MRGRSIDRYKSRLVYKSGSDKVKEKNKRTMRNFYLEPFNNKLFHINQIVTEISIDSSIYLDSKYSKLKYNK